MSIDGDHCDATKETVTGCAMCDVDWESCPDYQNITKLNGLQIAYIIAKAVNPKNTTARAGVNVQQLVKEKFPKQYKDLQLYSFDWNNLDGVLDFLYGERKLGLISSLYGIKIEDISEIIKLIESNCGVQ